MQTNEASQESEIKQVIRSLCMMNNRFMNFMLDDNKEAAQVFLRVILEDDKIKVRMSGYRALSKTFMDILRSWISWRRIAKDAIST